MILDKTNTPDEILDWVDDNDNVISTVAKKIANTNPKYIHREIALLIYDDHNRVLFQKRSHKKKVYPNIWTMTAGHVASGQTPFQAAHQEITEELGFDTTLVFVEKILERLPHEQFFENWFIGKYNNEKIIFEKEEIDDIQFASQEEAKSLIGDRITNPLENWDWRMLERFWNGKLDNLKKQLQ